MSRRPTSSKKESRIEDDLFEPDKVEKEEDKGAHGFPSRNELVVDIYFKENRSEDFKMVNYLFVNLDKKASISEVICEDPTVSNLKIKKLREELEESEEKENDEKQNRPWFDYL